MGMSLGITEDVIARQPPEARAIIRLLLAKIAELEARIEELQRQGKGKTPQNSSLPPDGVHEEKLAVKRHHEQYGRSGPSMREKNLERLIAMYEKIGTSGRKDYPPRPSPGEVLPEDQDYPRESTKVKPNPPEMEKGPRER